MSRSNNAGRSDSARFALRSHQWAKGDAIDEGETAVIDLPTDDSDPMLLMKAGVASLLAAVTKSGSMR